jgi:[acyl-carrier-protein] S-malonyltransferase
MKLAFVFPGQGSQSVGMMQGYEGLPQIRETFEQASTLFGEDLWRLAVEGPAEKLNLTAYTQPLMLIAGVAVYRAWKAFEGLLPHIVAGHSLGEYTALVAAGALSFEDALPLVRHRAAAMQDAVPEGIGGMAAILGLADDAVVEVCREAAQGDVLEAANFNAPSQVVIAGNKAAVQRGADLAKAKGAKRSVLLPMSVPSHCSLMQPAAERLTAYLSKVTFATPMIPVVQNADVASYGDPREIKAALARQLYNPVRWVQTVSHLAQQGVTHLVECGPGKVLAGLNKRSAGDLAQYSLADAGSFQDALTAVRSAT